MSDNIVKRKKFTKYYNNSVRLGSNKILIEFLDLNNDTVLPLSISHGVDFNHISFPMEAMCIEPIHWAYNDYIYSRSIDIKPSVRIPHPWLLLEKIKRSDEFPLLIIGPPPSKKNDQSLLELLISSGYTDFHILVKDKQDTNYISKKFWHSHGIKTISAGTRDDEFYFRLYEILHSYKKIVGCTISSALVFGSSIGCELELMEDYFFEVYETSSHAEIYSYVNNLLPIFTRKILNGNQNNQQNFSREILGQQHMRSPEEIRQDLFEVIESLNCHFYFNKNTSKAERYIRQNLVLLSGRTSFANIKFDDLVRKFFLKEVLKVRTNNIDTALFGRNKKNYSFESVHYKKNITEPGRGA